MTPAETLITAATKVRETTAGVSHYNTPWKVEPGEDDQWHVMYVTGNPLAGLIATTPDYGRMYLVECVRQARALTTARAILGEAP